MFRQGKPRAFIHNLRLASMLSFVAGIVNICGVLSITTLTTNVTGHFAFFSEEFISGKYEKALLYIIYIFSFLLGAFVSSLLLEIMLRKSPRTSHALPMMLEMSIFIFLGLAATRLHLTNELIASILLFSMGLQNALVTKVSQATVRTTHLTGLFTDLGIEFSQLLFRRDKGESAKLSRSIYLRLTIIVCFFFGGVVGGFLYEKMQLQALLMAAAALVIAFLYDNLRFTFHHYRRKLQPKDF